MLAQFLRWFLTPIIRWALWVWGGKGRKERNSSVIVLWERDSGSVVLLIQERSVHTTKWSITSQTCPAASGMVPREVADPFAWLWHSWAISSFTHKDILVLCWMQRQQPHLGGLKGSLHHTGKSAQQHWNPFCSCFCLVPEAIQDIFDG